MGRMVFGDDGTAKAAPAGTQAGQLSRHGGQHQKQRGAGGAQQQRQEPWGPKGGVKSKQYATGGKGHQQQGKRKFQPDEDTEFYRRALKRMEMGPADEDSLSDLSEELDQANHRPAALNGVVDKTQPQKQGQQTTEQQNTGKQSLKRFHSQHESSEDDGEVLDDGGNSDDDDDESGGDFSNDDDQEEEGEGKPAKGSARLLQPGLMRPSAADDSDEEEEEEGHGPEEPSSKGVKGRGHLERRPALMKGKGVEVGESDASDDEGDKSEDGEEDDNDSDDEDGAMRQLSDLPLETRLALLKDGSGPIGAVAQAAAREARAQEANFKRANKHRPQEMSSKKPVSRFREVVEPVRKAAKDPRFARLVSDTDKSVAARRYSFLYDDVLAKEKSDLRNKIKAERKPNVKAVLSAQLQRIEQALTRESQRRVSEEVEAKVKAKQRSAVASGHTPFFLKSSDKRKLELVAKYEQLKSKGKLDRFMEKRRKHNASKDHRYLPSGRRGEEGDE